MAQAEKTAGQASGAQNGGTNVVSLGPRDTLQGRLEIQGDLKVAGTVEGAATNVELSGQTLQLGPDDALPDAGRFARRRAT